MTAQDQARIAAHVVGRVQGVGFRHFATTQARRLGLKGWVRNERDGSVRAVAEGPRDMLETFLEQLRAGPPGARVERVATDWERASGDFDGFTVQYA